MGANAYVQGYRAFEEGRSDAHCPYNREDPRYGMCRTDWMSGYYWARTISRVGHILNKYGQGMEENGKVKNSTRK